MLLFLAALTAGLLFSAAFPHPAVHDDAFEYRALARNVAAGRGFTFDGTTPSAYRAPLFPSLLGGWFRLGGDASPGAIASFQSVVHALGTVAGWLLLLELVPFAPAFAGGLFLALQPLLVTRVVFVLQEPVLLLATTLAALASIRWIRSPSPGRAALAGFAWGVCALAKPVVLFAPLLLAATRLLPARFGFPRRGGDAALCLLAFALAVAPWTARNFARFHRVIPVTAQGEGLLEWSVAQTPVAGDPERAALLAERANGVKDEAGYRRRLWRFVLRHPREFLLERTAGNALRFGAPPRDWWIERGMVRPGEHRPWFWLLSLLFHVPLYLALLAATRSALRGAAAPGLAFLVLFYWVYWGEHAILWGDPRYGLAVYPVLLAIALATILSVSGRGSAASPRIPG
jgi:hypothetical protein